MWKQIRNYNYQISEEGIVRNIRTSKIRNSFIRKDGYVGIQLYLGKVVNFQLHRLIAEAFIPNPDNKPFVNHIDSNRANNSIENLEWCTHQENVIHSYKTGYSSNKGSKNGFSKLNENIVIEIYQKHLLGLTNKEIASEYGVSKNCIQQVVKRITWKHVVL